MFTVAKLMNTRALVNSADIFLEAPDRYSHPSPHLPRLSEREGEKVLKVESQLLFDFYFRQEVFHYQDFQIMFTGGESDLLPVRMNTQAEISLI